MKNPGSFEVPIIIPACGVLLNAALIVARVTAANANPRAPIIAGAIALTAAVLYFILRPANVTEETLAAVEQDS